MNLKSTTILPLLTLFVNFAAAQDSDGFVQVSGAMRNVMQKGQLQETIRLDTIQSKKHLYGLGPKAFLKGELLVIDGKSYVSTIGKDGSIKMEETFNAEAPFFVFANQESWEAATLPEDVKTIKQLEAYIGKATQKSSRPFVFKLKGTFKNVRFHIQNLPDNALVRSPEDAHRGQGKYERENVEGEIVGFFSTKHQAVFTHHDSYIHMHFINQERTEMGHLDDLKLDGASQITLYLPQE